MRSMTRPLRLLSACDNNNSTSATGTTSDASTATSARADRACVGDDGWAGAGRRALCRGPKLPCMVVCEYCTGRANVNEPRVAPELSTVAAPGLGGAETDLQKLTTKPARQQKQLCQLRDERRRIYLAVGHHVAEKL